MKKRSLKSLKLNKEPISKLNTFQINGGVFSWFWCNDDEEEEETPTPNSTPNNLNTCQAETCIYLDGC